MASSAAASKPLSTKQQEHNAYIPGHKPKHIQSHSWRTAENSCAYLLPTLNEKVQANPRLQVLDCGAGPGTITASLANYLPEGHIIATDLSSDIMAQAQTIAAPNMSTQVASVYELPFGAATFDVVHAQQVLCHLDQPLHALREMLRVCRPGGIVALREADIRLWNFWPEVPGVLETHKALMAVMDAAGGSNNMGVRLVSLALEAGVKRADIKASMGTWCYSTPEERRMWADTFTTRLHDGNMRTMILEQKLGWTAEELDAMAADWEKWIAAEDGCFGCIHGEVILTKR